jgi:hypothetical protein
MSGTYDIEKEEPALQAKGEHMKKAPSFLCLSYIQNAMFKNEFA